MNYSSARFFERRQNESLVAWLIRKIFVEEWFLKLIALAITLALWIGVNGFRDSRRLERVSLNLRTIDDVAIMSSPKQEVDLIVTGDRRDLARLDPRELGAVVEIGGNETGDRLVQLSPDVISIDLPNGVRVTDVQPQRIAVRLEKVLIRELPLKIETEGKLADGYELYEKAPSIPKARVRGAQSVVAPLDAVETEKINIQNRKADFTMRQVGLISPNPNVSMLDSIVDITFKIGELRTEKTFLVPVITNGSNKTASVTLRAPRTVLDKLRVEDMKIESTKSANGDSQPKLIFPPNISDRIKIVKLKID
jgi:YbbR domain-containing protein